MIENIIFDLGNVLLNYKPKEFLLRFTQDIELINSFVKDINGSDTWLDLDRGIITIDEARDYFVSQYPEKKELILLYFEHWVEGLTPIQENIDILKELHEKGYKTYILSNYMQEPYDIVKTKHDFFSLVDGQVISYEIHSIKPEKEIYQTLLSRYNLVPEECVFIDDHQFVLDVAKEFGINTILYNPEVDLREELRKLNVHV
jgi:putative hydrolase of the HAD superfamily